MLFNSRSHHGRRFAVLFIIFLMMLGLVAYAESTVVVKTQISVNVSDSFLNYLNELRVKSAGTQGKSTAVSAVSAADNNKPSTAGPPSSKPVGKP